MCNIDTNVLYITSVTGYKVALRKRSNGKVRYYSPSTGIEYKVGKVPILNSNTERIKVNKGFAMCLNNFSELVNSAIYNKFFNGLTAVFENVQDARHLQNKLVQGTIILRLTLSDRIHKGDYTGAKIFAGAYINTIEEWDKLK